MELSDPLPQIFEFGGDRVTFHPAPWDTQALNKNAINISKIESASTSYQDLLKAFIKKHKTHGVEFYSVRIPANNRALKFALQTVGFQIVEHTLEVTASPFDVSKANELLARIPVTTTNQILTHIDEVQTIAEQAFFYGRFHEDPSISIEIANQRNKNWINDLISQQASFNILIKKEKVLGFMAWKSDEKNNAKLLFGGVSENFQHLSYSFWADTLLKLASSTSITTTISSSNTPVINLYSYFGFHFTNPQFGLHLHS